MSKDKCCVEICSPQVLPHSYLLANVEGTNAEVEDDSAEKKLVINTDGKAKITTL